ncbi:type I-B CRISPR-associated protein Cas5b [Clostridium sporogenes]|uniref:CRISPR-associated protein Cas5, hmari subtype n=1 Tax=Clostridium cochlearium TaxID=1494 RepID=A0A2X2W5X5_CLOCO|nr:type I-B CRISPR-associated protein Cas5b [Clostridium cochlearium]MBU5268918.1 type I-B CRISPR-associated protein Cas5b [Clostridium cochlearium]MCR1970495.1 type I-B CRISPR-associated protein Cas5b [Clostridium cochlearium]NOH15540.1 type I-B CRISPR-associated protein Cas5 [Clostridium cochlearium]SQB33063.1 CRISPR-associated protein Cas5, hmari subtype [Clostridium cochlearium]
MNALKFNLSGRTAFFKKPDVNSFYYFTYGNIHKVALLGILGAICGYGGYNSQCLNKEQIYPEFYEKLKDINIGIVPKNEKGYIDKKIQVFNNSVGYASRELGGNLIVKEQWLENPKWDIYILIDENVPEDLKNRLLNSRFKYIPYLGKNDHMANITDAEYIENIEKLDNVEKVDSIFIKDKFEIQKLDDDLFDMVNDSYEDVSEYKYEEMLPVSLEETTNKYNLETFIYTNSKLKSLTDSKTYQCDDKNIFFF